MICIGEMVPLLIKRELIMLNIIELHFTTGKNVVVAVVSNDKNYPNLNQHLNEWLAREYGRSAIFNYIESFACPDVDIASFKVQRFLNMDEIIENAK